MSSSITFITTLASSSASFDFRIIYVLPNPFAVTFPVSSSTVAILLSKDLYVKPLFSAISNNKLNPYTVSGFIWYSGFDNFNVTSLWFNLIYCVDIHSNLLVDVVEPSPNSP